MELYLLLSNFDTTFKGVIIEALSRSIKKEIFVSLHLLSSLQIIRNKQVLSLTNHLLLWKTAPKQHDNWLDELHPIAERIDIW